MQSERFLPITPCRLLYSDIRADAFARESCWSLLLEEDSACQEAELAFVQWGVPEDRSKPL